MNKFFFSFVVGLWVMILLNMPLIAQENNESLAVLNWLELDNKINNKYWTADYRDKDRELYIKPIWKKKNGEEGKKILGMLPKKSSSYTTAVNVLLSTLQKEKIYAEFYVYNFKGKQNLAKNIVDNALAQEFDLVYSMGSATAEFFFNSYRNIEIPVVTAITKDPVTMGWVENYESGTQSNIATTSLNVHPKILTNYILDMVPDLENVVILYEFEHTQVRKTEVEPLINVLKKNKQHKPINFHRLIVENRKDAYKILNSKLPIVINELEKSDVGLTKSIILLTSSTTVFSNIELINQHSKQLPVISLVPNIVRQGEHSALIAIGIDRRNNAQIASSEIGRAHV